jgi:hypothetical protein
MELLQNCDDNQVIPIFPYSLHFDSHIPIPAHITNNSPLPPHTHTQYAPLVQPTIKLQLYPHVVVVKNNELGFSEANVVAVSNVGGSTKSGHTGYIGQKGIGFKSVFSVSDTPEIHSNGETPPLLPQLSINTQLSIHTYSLTPLITSTLPTHSHTLSNTHSLTHTLTHTHTHTQAST